MMEEEEEEEGDRSPRCRKNGTKLNAATETEDRVDNKRQSER